MNDETRCARTDLPVASCDHCRPKPSPIRALYPGTCATCGGLIYIGEQIRERGDGQYEHGRHR
jgi:hypothetical protein